MSSEKPQVKAFAVLQRTEEESGKKREKHSSMEHSGKFDVKNFFCLSGIPIKCCPLMFVE